MSSQKTPYLFGVRHLSPRGAYELVKFLDEKDPDIVLVEGPSDFNEMMADVCREETKPPFAFMAYTRESPIAVSIYPMAVYSPEYQAILWAHRNNKQCRFIDLPSGTFLCIGKEKEDAENEESENDAEPIGVRIKKAVGEETETWWERNIEYTAVDYREAVNEYGKQIRMSDNSRGKYDVAENMVRECYMKRQIEEALKEFSPEKTVVVTGAYHVSGLENCSALTDKEIKTLPSVTSLATLMPYSYYRLSARSGYGAGNNAPQYFEMIWDSLCKGDKEYTSYMYVTKIAEYMRANGGITSSAEVIETIRLAKTLAYMRGSRIPSLSDLRDSVISCIGHGNLSEVSKAFAFNEVGTKIGSLPEGVSRTAMQEDFYIKLKELKLEKYKSMCTQTIELDLRENIHVKTEKYKFIDLRRSFFFNRLGVLGIDFAKNQHKVQSRATWSEVWNLQWTPETEIQIVEAAINGDSVRLATEFVFKQKLEMASSIKEISAVISQACLCGMEDTVNAAVRALQQFSVDAVSLGELAMSLEQLSNSVKYGSIRYIDTTHFIPVMKQMFYRSCIVLVSSCRCNNDAVRDVISAMSILNAVDTDNDFIDSEEWVKVLCDAALRDDINTKASGYAMSILLERSVFSSEQLSTEVQRRLSKGMPSDLGAAWFEGLSIRNHYTLITRLSLWEKLAEYVDTLDDEEFKRALVFLRRAFSSYSSLEKDQIAENLGEIWGVNAQQVSEVINSAVTEEQQEIIDSLDDFDFGDL